MRMTGIVAIKIHTCSSNYFSSQSQPFSDPNTLGHPSLCLPNLTGLGVGMPAWELSNIQALITSC